MRYMKTHYTREPSAKEIAKARAKLESELAKGEVWEPTKYRGVGAARATSAIVRDGRARLVNRPCTRNDAYTGKEYADTATYLMPVAAEPTQ